MRLTSLCLSEHYLLMISFRPRPGFDHTVTMRMEEAQDKITRRISRDDAAFEVKNYPGFICLRMPTGDRHFWSPRLNISIEPSGETETVIRGKYGPNANVWSLFLFCYLTLGSLGMFSGILAISQWVIGSDPWAFWLFGGAALGFIVLFAVAQGGQRLGARQIQLLHQTYESGINESVEIH